MRPSSALRYSHEASLCPAGWQTDWKHRHDGGGAHSAFIMVCIGVSIAWNGVMALPAEIVIPH